MLANMQVCCNVLSLPLYLISSIDGLADKANELQIFRITMNQSEMAVYMLLNISCIELMRVSEWPLRLSLLSKYHH